MDQAAQPLQLLIVYALAQVDRLARRQDRQDRLGGLAAPPTARDGPDVMGDAHHFVQWHKPPLEQRSVLDAVCADSELLET